ncbi:MAG: hypothetical protein V4617_15130 [Gemmatimonadota bacterium]
MAKRTGYTPNAARGAALRRATDAGLVAAANIVTRSVKLRFRERDQGYTTGDYAHTMGGVASTITQSEPHDAEGVRRVTIGTNKRSPEGYSYPLAWELGHVNVAMGDQGNDASSLATRSVGSFQRVETFRPALDENRDLARAAFARTVKRFLRQGALPSAD